MKFIMWVATRAAVEANCGRHRPERLSWAKLFRRVFDLNREHCRSKRLRF